MDKRILNLEYPCSNKCIVKACCEETCDAFRKYFDEVYHSLKYRCFEIQPEPPLVVVEVARIMNRVEGKDNFACVYSTDSDTLTIDKVNPNLRKWVIKNTRKLNSLREVNKFPQELLWYY